MTDHFIFLALGLGNGAVYAALGLALVMTFRSSGVVNFSTGAIALYVAYTYGLLRKGELLNPIPGMPRTVDLGGPMGVAPAMAISLAIAALWGVLIYAIVFRPLRTAPPVAKAVASIGVMLFMQALLAVRVGTTPVSVKAILPSGVLTVAGARIPADRLWFAAVILALAVALTLAFRWTRFGLATRAAAESEKGALVTGLSPERIAFGNWALSTMVAGLSGILIAPIVPLIPVSYTLFIVPALAAALVGNFSAMGWTVVAGLGIGMLQSEMTHLQSTVSWFPQSGMGELVPLVMILIFLVVRGRPLPSRGAIIQQTLGRAPRPQGLLVPTLISVAVALLGLLLTSGSYRAAVIMTLVLAIVALSQVVVTGFAGQISLAQLTLAGVSAFTLSRLGNDLGIPFPIAPVLAALVATVIGVVVGLPALRIRGLPVTVVTLALAVFLEQFWFRNSNLNGGLDGAGIEAPSLFGLDLGIGSGDAYPRIPFGILCLVVLTVVALAVAKLRTSRLGASMLAVRANERSAAAAGIDVARTKIKAFAIGAFIAGLGGALMGYQQTLATAESYSVLAGIGLFAIVYIAGITCVSGGILAGVIGAGGFVFIVMDRLLHLGSYYAMLSGIFLILTVIRYPEGLIGHLHEHSARVRRLAARVRPPAKAEPVTVRPADAETPRLVREITDEVLLSADGIGVRYGGVVALDDVTFDVRSGEIIGLIGPNGAGKTTCIDALSGFANSSGTVSLGDQRVDGLKPHERSRLGLGRTFQGIELYDDLTVRENVAVGTVAAANRKGDAEAPSDEEIDTLFGVLQLTDVADRSVSELSQGQRQLVSVARALAGRPRIVLLDEPAAGLDSTESQWLGERLKSVRDAGVTVLMVDHDMELVLEICDRIVVLDLGRVIASGTPQEIQTNPDVVRAYLGTTHASTEVPA
ncbi:branched-chain amino acid ABC transporter permease/ATP-binding protein [Rhodococcus opacus]|uniref:branched-chain amino acid ABC transporter permease/ATP-binding protein n=1 Tax=Rhodococcus opacus TaxID=37919 RepID=UPI001C44B6E0|nr:branched-chain amino acid ABC transporter permease/ATP-binding protein [Rhodococcus opacus]MBV6756226.1 ATP-binding cassette domain-containing protein [Rhodococcus opacus]